jgi:hypothetical protein
MFTIFMISVFLCFVVDAKTCESSSLDELVDCKINQALHPLEKKIQKLEEDLEVAKKKLAAAELNLDMTKSQLEEIDLANFVKLHNGRIPQNQLPGLYATTNLQDIQWQALHMAAAAACRGSTARGGHGPWSNGVIPGSSKVSCKTLCRRLPNRKVCDAKVSISGFMGRTGSHKELVGAFYNYGCKSGGHQYDEVNGSDKNLRYRGGNYFSFCCCRKAY